MTITANDEYMHPARISIDKFGQLLRQHANPAVLAERSADEYYQAIVSRGVDPLMILAMFNHESSMGKAGVAVTSKSWGNTRAPNFGATPVGEMPGRTGVFPIWASWLDGCISTVARLATLDYYYAGERRNIGEVFSDPHYPTRDPNRPIHPPNPRRPNDPREWAPAGDLNSPSSYLGAMLRFMNQHQDIGSGKEPPVQHPPHNLPLRVSHIPRGNHNRPGHPMVPRYITIHETSNYNVGANAEMHRRFVNQGGGSGNVSWHFTVDDSEIVEHLPTTENGWHAGDGGSGTGNRESIGIELCVNADGDFTATRALAARLVARLMETRNIPIERVVQHNHWSGKNCPLIIRRDGLWDGFIQSVRAITERDPQQPEPGPPHPSARYFDITGQYIAQGFRDYWEQFGDDRVSIEVFGYPLSGELPFTTPDGAEGSQQYFERAVFEWHPGKGRVLLRRLGAEELERAA